MKKFYSKPLISVEAMTLDQPIATNCTADKDIMEILIEFGYFMDEPETKCTAFGEGGKVDSDFDGDVDEHDTICYHSNIQQAFLS